MTTSSVSAPTAPSVNLGNAQDVSSLVSSNVDLSLADAVTSKVQPYLDQATAIQTEINTNQTQIAAYQNMQSLLTALQSAASNLTSESLQGSNVFQGRAANLSSSSATAAASILTAAVASGTTTGSHTVTVNQLAEAEADTSDTLALSSTAAINSLGGSVTTYDGTITVAESGKKSPVAVTIAPTMTLAQVAAAINAATNTNGVVASVVSVDSAHQVLVLSAQDADQPLNYTDDDSILQGLGVITTPSSNQMLSTVTLPGGTPGSGGASAGSFTIHGGVSGTPPVAAVVPVTLTGGESAQDIADQINAAHTSVTASVSGNQLQINEANGAPLSLSDIITTGAIPPATPILDSVGLTATVAKNQVTAPTSANLTVDGVQNITRPTNTISDVLNGVTLNVTQADPNTKVTIQVAPDANTAATAIQSFVTAYNSWESFVQQNEATDSSGNASASATLFGDSSLREASLQIDSSITQEVNGTSMGALGISLDGNNNMQIDATTLDDALNNSFDTVANLFQSTLTSSSANLVPSGSNLASFGGTLSMTIGMTGSDIGSLSVMSNGSTDVSSDFIFAGNTIQGLFGTPYSGMFFNYNGTGETATVNSTQGVGNMVYTAANNFGNTTTGSVQALITDKQSQDTQFTSQYNNWVNEANDYTNFLLNQYSSLTTQIQTAGQTLNTLNALFTAQYSSNG